MPRPRKFRSDRGNSPGAVFFRGDVVSAPSYEPTPAEIKALCAVIRSEWDAQTEQARRCVGFQRVEWSIPGVDQHREIVSRETTANFVGDW